MCPTLKPRLRLALVIVMAFSWFFFIYDTFEFTENVFGFEQKRVDEVMKVQNQGRNLLIESGWSKATHSQPSVVVCC